jgi:hypothetical protein
MQLGQGDSYTQTLSQLGNIEMSMDTSQPVVAVFEIDFMAGMMHKQ